MSTKKTAPAKAAAPQSKPPVTLQPVRIEQAPAETNTTKGRAPKTGTARLVNNATGQVVTMARNLAEQLSSQYPKQYQIIA